MAAILEFSKTILLVEDGKADAEFIRLALDEKGYEVHHARDAAQCFELLKRISPDLILLDIRLPGLDGLGILERIKHFDGLKEVPILFLTTLATPEILKEAAKLGVDDYILKSHDPEELLNRVGQHLQHWDRESIRKLLQNASSPSNDFFSSVPLEGFSNDLWDAYRIEDRGVKIALLLQKGLNPKDVADNLNHSTSSRIRVMALMGFTWKRVWP